MFGQQTQMEQYLDELAALPRIRGCAVIRDEAMLAGVIADDLQPRWPAVLDHVAELAAMVASEWATGEAGSMLLRGDDGLVQLTRLTTGTYLVVLAPSDATVAWLRLVTRDTVHALRAHLRSVP